MSRFAFFISTIISVLLLTVHCTSDTAPALHSELHYVLAKVKDLPTNSEDAEIKPKNFTIDQPGCQIPELELYNSVISSLIRPEPDLYCDNRTTGKPHPPLVRDIANFMHFDLRSLEYYENATVTCQYRSFERKPSSLNDEVSYSSSMRPLNLVNVTEITSESDEFINVVCNDTSNDDLIYEDYLAFVPLKPKVEKRCQNIAQKKKGDQISPLIIGFDSLSRLQFQRQMPRSHDLLQNMNAVEMKGYHRVGLNRFSNLVPVMAGLSADELDDTCISRNGILDTCPFVWKQFRNNGFRTVFAEDDPYFSIFNFRAEGFDSQPTDYYLSPFYQEADEHIGFYENDCSNRCLGAKPSLEFILKHALKTAQTFNDKNYFGLFWSCSVTCNTFNFPAQTDGIVYNALYEMKSSQLLNNTVLIVMSDRGPSLVTEFMRTEQGQYERTLPLLTFVFPQWFEQKYSLAVANLRRNAEKLTTPYDLHETLLDFMDLSEVTNGKLKTQKEEKIIQRGLSLLRSIPETRNCNVAHIPKNYCACNDQGLTLVERI